MPRGAAAATEEGDIDKTAAAPPLPEPPLSPRNTSVDMGEIGGNRCVWLPALDSANAAAAFPPPPSAAGANENGSPMPLPLPTLAVKGSPPPAAAEEQEIE